MRRLALALVAASLSLASVASAAPYGASNAWQAAAYANQQRVGQLSNQLATMVREGRVNSGVQAMQFWQNNYRPQIPSGALGGMPRYRR